LIPGHPLYSTHSAGSKSVSISLQVPCRTGGARDAFLLVKLVLAIAHVVQALPQGKVTVADSVATLRDNTEVRAAYFGKN
jgi:hypothetical protein